MVVSRFEMPRSRPTNVRDTSVAKPDQQTVDLLRESLCDLITGSSESYFKCHILARLGVDQIGQLDGQLEQLLNGKTDRSSVQSQDQVEDWNMMEQQPCKPEDEMDRSDYDQLKNVHLKPQFQGQDVWSSQQSIPGFTSAGKEETNDFDLIAQHGGLLFNLGPAKQELIFDF